MTDTYRLLILYFCFLYRTMDLYRDGVGIEKQVMQMKNKKKPTNQPTQDAGKVGDSPKTVTSYNFTQHIPQE